MLFVFQVDTGRMMTFDMSLALESVQHLKSYVERTYNIPQDKQVLLISGGQYLRPDDRICSYASGTDTNPIFLFSKPILESDLPPAAFVESGVEQDFSARVRESGELPATYNTVQRRAQLSRLIYEVSQKLLSLCEKLVHEQHLQQQGWSAVVANLEDLNSDLKHRWHLYREVFHEFIVKRDTYLEFLNQFKDDLLILQKIPVLPTLLESQNRLVEDFNGAKETQIVTSEMTLHDWIIQNDDFMESLFEICSKGVLQTDESDFYHLQEDIEKKILMTDDITMKEIKGLSDRLFGLEKLMQEAKRHVGEQSRLAEAIQRNFQNTSKPNQVRDTSVLPDLCATHHQQLLVMLENYNRLRDILRRCIRAKDELSSNLFHRLKWIVYMEDNLSELDNKLVFNYENLLSLQRHLEILQQVHTAPMVYFSSIVEVVRRRNISQSFLLWASDVACHLLTIYNEEIARRKDFQSQIENHFLSSLFPGMEDLPPSFATQAPSIFDSSLPKLTEDDIEKLKELLPTMMEFLQIPNTSAITNYFTIKDVKDELDKTVNKAVEDKLIEVVNEAGLTANMEHTLLKGGDSEQLQTTPPGLSHLKELDKGCESETDTEEFEKVGQSPFDLHFDKGSILSPRPGTQDASTLTEETLQISRSDHEKLKTLFLNLYQTGQQVYSQLREELDEIKSKFLQEKLVINDTFDHLKTVIDNISLSKENSEREIIQRLTVDHELEISDFRKIAQSKNEEIKILRDEKNKMVKELSIIAQKNAQNNQKLEDNVKILEEMKQRIEEVNFEKEKCVREVSERLKSEYKNELDSMRSRFKLMTMERSPSENSLEKIERGDYPSITSHETRILQLTENFELEKEVAVSDAVNCETQKWERLLDERIKEMEINFQQERVFLVQDVHARIQQDQEKQISQFREQINNLTLESIKYKDTIQQLTEYSEASVSNEILQRIDCLERENLCLRRDLEKFTAIESGVCGMATSVAVCEGAATIDAATSPVKIRKRSESSSVASPRSLKLNTDSCRAGDLVLVVWDTTHLNYRILNDNNSLYFVNSDYLESLDLKVTDGQPNKLFCYAEVLEKEYCHARKSINRFRVPQGTKFFRVKVKASSKEILGVNTAQSGPMSQSQTVTSSRIPETVPSVAPSSLPSTPTKNWEKSDTQEPTILEEKGEDSTILPDGKGTDVERGTELTEGFNIDSQTSIDRNEADSCLLLSSRK